MHGGDESDGRETIQNPNKDRDPAMAHGEWRMANDEWRMDHGSRPNLFLHWSPTLTFNVGSGQCFHGAMLRLPGNPGPVGPGTQVPAWHSGDGRRGSQWRGRAGGYACRRRRRCRRASVASVGGMFGTFSTSRPLMLGACGAADTPGSWCSV